MVRSVCPQAKALLDVACGTGAHARALAAQGFEVEGTDIEPAFVEIASSKHPEGSYFEADMPTLETPKCYDAVVWLFSSIGYAGMVDRLNQTLRAFARAVHPAGVVIVEPWFEPGQMTHGFVALHAAATEDVEICRMSRTILHRTRSTLTFEYLIGRSSGIERFSEHHDLGLFNCQEMEKAFRQARLSVTHDPEGLTGRGLHIGQPA